MKAQTTESLAVRRIAESIAIKQALLEDESLIESLERTAFQIADALRTGHKVMFMGNGGSAADAQHLSAEFTGKYLLDRRPLPAMALNVNTSAITAIANDYSFDMIFARQIEGLAQPGDVAVGLSTSGNSLNVVLAMEAARQRQLFTIGLTGESGGRLKHVVDICFRIPSSETPRIQECQIMLGHILCEIVEDELCT